MNTDIIWIILATVFVFLLIREVWCWYWKINHVISQMDKITNILIDIRDKKE